jgi:hypothetical protein
MFRYRPFQVRQIRWPTTSLLQAVNGYRHIGCLRCMHRPCTTKPWNFNIRHGSESRCPNAFVLLLDCHVKVDIRHVAWPGRRNKTPAVPLEQRSKQLPHIDPCCGSQVHQRTGKFARTDYTKTGFAARDSEHERSEGEGGLSPLCALLTAHRRAQRAASGQVFAPSASLIGGRDSNRLSGAVAGEPVDGQRQPPVVISRSATAVGALRR